MAKVLGIIDLHYKVDLGVLTEKRSIASAGVFGRYCFIDFPLSNFANSGINRIGILIKDKPRSLFRHLGLTNNWALNTKIGGISLLYNENYANDPYYNTDVNNILENYWFIRDNKDYEYIVIAPAHFMMTINYTNFVKSHMESGAEITVLSKTINNAKEAFLSCQSLHIKDGNKVSKITTNIGDKDERVISLQTYIMHRDVFISLLKKSKKTSSGFELNDIICREIKNLDVRAYEFDGYVKCFNSFKSYFKNSLEILDINNYKSLFNDDDHPIFTRTYDTPPAKYGRNADIKNSFIANGSVINGTCINSLLGREVVIEEGAVVKDSILLSKVHIAKGCHIENAVIDKETTVMYTKEVIGTKDNPIGIKQEDTI